MSDEVLRLPIAPTSAANLASSGLRFELLKSSDDGFLAWFQAMARGFYEPASDDDALKIRLAAFADRRLSGVWDDTAADPKTPIATASSWLMPLTVPGGRDVPALAISTITVAPTHRRRGIARNLVEAELRTAAKLGYPIAMLTVSEATIYGRFGFAPVSIAAEWTVDTRRAVWTGPTPGGRVQLVSTEQVRDEGGSDIVERARLRTPGQVGFDGHLWRRLFGLPGQSDLAAIRVARYDDASGAPQGFVIYTPREENHETTITVKYLAAATDDAYSALWRFLFELDLVTTVKAGLRPAVEPFYWQIADARAARADDVGDHLWARILDVKAALEGRSYSASGRFVLEITDSLGYADGDWLLDIDEEGNGSVGPVDVAQGSGRGVGEDHRIAMSINELACVYLGATSFDTLVRAGRITERTPAAADAADAAFRSSVTPWTSIGF